MERVVPFLADTSGPFKQLLAAEQTAQSVQAWIQEKEDAIRTIRQRVWEVDHDVPYSAVDGHIKRLQEDISHFKKMLECNEASRNSWRDLHMVAWRATVRPLQVVDMPNEILARIFANFEDFPAPQIQIDISRFNELLPSPDISSIKSIRLTCRTFCEVASEILLPVINFSFTRSSLQRLRDISVHPGVSKSVRVIRLHASPYSTITREFGNQTISELRNLCRSFINEPTMIEEEVTEAASLVGMTPQAQMLESRELDLDEALSQALLVITTLRKVLYNTWSMTSLDSYGNQIRKAIDEARDEYERRCLEQQSLLDSPDVLAEIITAVSHMPNVQKVCIPDEGSYHWDHIFRSGKDQRYDAQKFAAAMKATNPFWDLMIHGGWRDDAYSLLTPLEEPLFPLLHKLPSVLDVANQNLTHLNIHLPPLSSEHMETLEEHLLSLRHSFQSLKSVQITILESYFGVEDRDPETGLLMTYSLIETILVSPRIEEVKLDYRMRGKKSRILIQEDHSIGSVLINLPWNNLRSFHLNEFSIKLEELRQVLQDVAGKMHIDISRIFLLEGTWAEALEILRGKADPSSQVLVPRGEEMIHMSKSERRHFRSKFSDEARDGWDYDQQCPGLASFYIRGGNIPNPLIEGDD